MSVANIWKRRVEERAAQRRAKKRARLGADYGRWSPLLDNVINAVPINGKALTEYFEYLDDLAKVR